MAVEAVFRRMSRSEFRSILSKPLENNLCEASSRAYCRGASLSACQY